MKRCLPLLWTSPREAVMQQGQRNRDEPRRTRAGRPLIGLSALSALLLAAGGAMAARSIALYRGEPSGAGGLQLAGWGSGEAVDTSAEAFSGSNSIKLTTDGYYAGGRLVF